MPYFSIAGHATMPITVVKITDRKPKVVDRNEFQTHYLAALDVEAIAGAEIVVDRLDELFGKRCKAPGVYQAPYAEVREAYESLIKDHTQVAPDHSMPVRVVCGVTAAALLFVMCALAVPAGIFWLTVCAFRHQSGLRAMAETAVMFSIFDWTPLIEKLARIARYGR